jgi:hypothetical protein
VAVSKAFWLAKKMPNKAIKFVPATKDVASTGLPSRCFGSRLWRRKRAYQPTPKKLGPVLLMFEVGFVLNALWRRILAQ